MEERDGRDVGGEVGPPILTQELAGPVSLNPARSSFHLIQLPETESSREKG